MPTINTSIGYVNNGCDDGLPGTPAGGAAAAVYRTRGTIDITLNRLPQVSDINIAISEPINPLDAFLVVNAGTPTAGVTGAGTVNPGDYLVYISGTVTVAASWAAITNPSTLTQFPNSPPGFVRTVGSRGASSDTA